jgi:putative PIN family toxin of toxin-antitoxin system
LKPPADAAEQLRAVAFSPHSLVSIDIDFGITENTKMSHPLRVVFDTNVLYSALRSRLGISFRLLQLIGTQRFSLQVSAPLIAEYEAVLKRGNLALRHDQIDDVIDFLCAHSEHHKIFYLWRPTLKDPDDDFLLELAVKAQASIVTWNIADFKNASKFGVSVLTPREFFQQQENKT